MPQVPKEKHDSGRKIAEGPPTEVRRNPAVIESYLGRQVVDHA